MSRVKMVSKAAGLAKAEGSRTKQGRCPREEHTPREMPQERERWEHIIPGGRKPLGGASAASGTDLPSHQQERISV